MRLSISNIAWDAQDDNAVALFLKERGVDAIDIAPSKYFSAEMNPTEEEILAVKKFWSSFGIEIVGMQSLLFGTSGLNIFNLSSQENLLVHLEKVARIAQHLGAQFLVFGSPKNRDASVVDEVQVMSVAKDFFGKVGEIGLKYNVVFCVEPNPAIYSCNFLTHSMDAANFVKELNHPAVKMQLDIGTIVTNSEDYRSEIAIFKDYVGHIHLSTTHLKPIVQDKERLVPAIKVVKEYFSDRVMTIEMTTAPEVFESVLFAQEHI